MLDPEMNDYYYTNLRESGGRASASASGQQFLAESIAADVHHHGLDDHRYHAEELPRQEDALTQVPRPLTTPPDGYTRKRKRALVAPRGTFHWPDSQDPQTAVTRAAPRFTSSEEVETTIRQHRTLSRTADSARAASPQALVFAPIPQDQAIVSQASQNSTAATPGGSTVEPRVITNSHLELAAREMHLAARESIESDVHHNDHRHHAEELSPQGDALTQVPRPLTTPPEGYTRKQKRPQQRHGGPSTGQRAKTVKTRLQE